MKNQQTDISQCACSVFHVDGKPQVHLCPLHTAAPDLLAALVNAERDITDSRKCHSSRDMESLQLRALHTLRAAIASATT